MGAYNRFRGEYCCENDYLINQVLRKEWGFNGFVVSDWAAVHNTEKAAKGGLDVEMGTSNAYNEFFMADALLEAVKNGSIPEALVNEKVANILRVLFKIKAFEPENRVKGKLNDRETQKTAYLIASEAITLLKNDDHILPLRKDQLRKIAVIGDNATRRLANGGFGAGVKTQYEITPLEGLQNRLESSVELVFAQGYEKRSKIKYKNDIEREKLINDEPDYKLIAEAVAVAKKCDAVIIVGGLNLDYDTEASDRSSLKMPYGQDSLIAAVTRANPNTIMVVIAGSPVDLEIALSQTKAVVYGWLNGSEGGNALADVLLGNVNPSGKLPFTIPARLEDVSVHALGTYPGVEGKTSYDEGLLVGYRWFDTKKIEPQVPFGFGLSYTQFEYSNLVVNKETYRKNETIKLTFDLKNTGEKAGAEVVQVYVSDKGTLVERPEKELRAFTKEWLLPGESKNVSIEIPVKNLAFYNESIRDWTVETGQFDVMVASSSRNVRLNQIIEVK
jgi:beta-glucosidase